MSPLCPVYLTLCILLAAFAFGTFFLWRKYSVLQKQWKKTNLVAGDIEKYEARLNTAAAQLLELSQSINEKIATQQEIEAAIAIHQQAQAIAETQRQAAEEQARLAQELTKKHLELEAERKRMEFETQLHAELQELEARHPKTVLETELSTINARIEEARQTLLVQQEQMRNAAEAEDFIDFHSISLTPQDLRDIELIREFSPQLTRQEAFFKLIWTEFYQKPIQILCKSLGAEKVRGIYKITNAKSQRMYIGQAVDIAARWKDHCKTGLGIGSTSYMTNKFYKALHDEGIENFTFEILEMGDISLSERERYWIDFYNATSYGYNSKTGG
jgi:murein L,D-transpeptidase YcbB/YkuD